MWVRSLGQEDPLEEGMATHPSILPGESCGQRSLAGFSPWAPKSRTQLNTRTPTNTVIQYVREVLSRVISRWMTRLLEDLLKACSAQ